MKTLHRAAYEVLTPEEYKEFCRIPVKVFFPRDLIKDWNSIERFVISNSFSWWAAPEPQCGAGRIYYWSKINDRLISSSVVTQGGISHV